MNNLNNINILGSSIRISLRDSLWDSLDDSLDDSLEDSLSDSLWVFLRDSLKINYE